MTGDGQMTLENFLQQQDKTCHCKIQQGGEVLGKSQSPIDLSYKKDNSNTYRVTGSPKFQLKYQSTKVQVDNKFKANVVQGDNLAIIGNQTYKLVQYHYHQPAEHTVDGKTSCMELHLVHQLIKDGDHNVDTEKQALFAVVGVFMNQTDTQSPNKGLQIILDHHLDKKGPDFQVDGKDMMNEKILNGKHEIAAYQGSLTTPPFSELVMWHLVLNETIEITKQQKSDYLKVVGKENARECQSLFDRRIGIFTSN